MTRIQSNPNYFVPQTTTQQSTNLQATSQAQQAAAVRQLLELTAALQGLMQGLAQGLTSGVGQGGGVCGQVGGLGDLSSLFGGGGSSGITIGENGNGNVMPDHNCWHVPYGMPCPPPAKGLTTDVEGFPKGSVKTAGGYVVVPEGKDAAWSIYSPGSKPGDQPLSRIWGDPHVNEADGTRWDFTHNSNFRLPDGTTISVDTTSQTGQSVTSALNITNGADHVEITGINSGAPESSKVQYDGFRYRAHMGQRDEFLLGKADGSKGKDSVEWFRMDKQGNVEGLITGSKQDDKKTYDQTLQKTDKYGDPFEVDSDLLPKPGTKAWETVFENELKDALGFIPGAAKEFDKQGKAAENPPKFDWKEELKSIRDLGNLLNQISFLSQLSQLFPNKVS